MEKKKGVVAAIIAAALFIQGVSAAGTSYCENGVLFSNILFSEQSGELTISYDKSLCEYGCADTTSCKECVDTSWSPDASTYCSGENFVQTSNCGNTRTMIGTKQPECPAASTVQCGLPLISNNECSGCPGTGTLCEEGQSCVDGICKEATGGKCTGFIGCDVFTNEYDCVYVGECIWVPETTEGQCIGFIGCDTLTTQEDCEYNECIWVESPSQVQFECRVKNSRFGFPCYTLTTEQECLAEGVCMWAPVESSEEPPAEEDSQYTFEFPQAMKSGYYAVPCRYVPKDKTQYCNDCDKSGGNCAAYTGSNNNYLIKDGYVEDFTYSSDFPIYHSSELRSFSDFKGKCFVGDCNQANLRHVLCIDETGELTAQTFACDKWVNTYGFDTTEFCIDGKAYKLGTGDEEKGLIEYGTCQKTIKANFYYVYNENSAYEGYDAGWKARWQSNLDSVNQILSQFGITLQGAFYEYKLPDDDYIPSRYYPVTAYTAPDAFVPDTELHISIMAGKKHPSSYGYSCGQPTYGVNPCVAYGGGGITSYRYIRIPDYYATANGEGVRTLAHELGHTFGCPHTGEVGSLASHLYKGDLMSYGTTGTDLLYECRLVLWYYGQN